jgi:hypothetical protein
MEYGLHLTGGYGKVRTGTITSQAFAAFCLIKQQSLIRSNRSPFPQELVNVHRCGLCFFNSLSE